MRTTVIGAYPKIGDGADGQELRRALHRRDRGEIGEADLDRVFDSVTRSAIEEIEGAGVDVTNDGQIRWDDLLSPFAKAWSGVEPGPLERFYDNNTYFRQPIINGRLETDGRSLVRDYTFAAGIAKNKLKAAIPGPLTFATLAAQDDQYRSLEERVLAVADAAGKEIAGLKAAGATMIDIEDPAVIAVAEQFLRLISWNFAASGIIFTCSGIFQGLGYTWPALGSSASRLLTFMLPSIWLSMQPWLELHHVWYTSVTSVWLQAALSVFLLMRVMKAKLGPA